jgi:hypothetical protein
MGALREILAKFGFEIDDSKLDSLRDRVDNTASKIKDLADKFAGGSLSGAIKDWIGDVKEAAGEFKGLAKLTGTSAEDMQRWTTAAKLSGSSVEALATGFRVLLRNASQASSGGESALEDLGDGSLEAVLSGKKAQQMFKALGVDVKTSTGELKTASQLMGDVGLGLAKIKSPAERAALATKLFGRQGTMLLPLFAQGEEGLRGFLDRIDELGGGVSSDALKALGDNSKATKEYDVATLSLKSAIVTELLPAMTKKIKLLTDVSVWFLKTQKGTEILRSGILVLGAAILYTQRQAVIAGLRTAVAWAPTILLFAFLALVVDDVWTAMKGGDSVLTRTGKKWLEFLAGSSKNAETNQAVWDEFIKTIKETSWSDIFGGSLDYWKAVFAGMLPDTVKEFISWFNQDLPAGIKNGSASFVDTVVAVFKNIQNKLYTWPLDLVDGIIEGFVKALQDRGFKISDAFVEQFHESIKKVKDALEMHSPSRVVFRMVDTGIIGASVLALSEGAKRIADQATQTFAPMVPDAAGFAPTVKVPTFATAGPTGPTMRQVNQSNQVKIVLEGNIPDAYRDAVREGVGLGFSDERRGMLAALEDLGP